MPQVDRTIGITAAALGIAAQVSCSIPSSAPVDTAATVSGGPGTATTLASAPPPPSRAEIPPPSPSPLALWRFGHWSWNGAKYIWIAGHYAQRPSPTANWIPGYWQQRPEGWMWVEGQWTS
jgi:hypothetical protein